ncbi:MAG: Plug domain-containing protein [Gemmatimonadetes bacterium]|nr:Plug domain-containing protein [Gemmatimonadota bacterium]
MRLTPISLLLVLALASRGARVDAQTSRDSSTYLDSTRVPSLRPIRVLGRVDELRGFASTASQGHVGSADLRLRPLMREGELLESVPGLIVTQHSGDGKSNQLFVRGFNLDHGTDFSTKVEGMPVNMASHAHGQGYTRRGEALRRSLASRTAAAEVQRPRALRRHARPVASLGARDGVSQRLGRLRPDPHAHRDRRNPRPLRASRSIARRRVIAVLTLRAMGSCRRPFGAAGATLRYRVDAGSLLQLHLLPRGRVRG